MCVELTTVEIRRAVRNLVENAVAYGNKAEVQIANNSDGYDIVIEDEGPGIPEAYSLSLRLPVHGSWLRIQL